mgnify:CR=1 FL=1
MTTKQFNKEMNLVMNEIDNEFLKNLLFPKEGTSSSDINNNKHNDQYAYSFVFFANYT